MRNPGAEVYSLPPKPQHQKQDPVELASGQVEQLYRQKEEEGEFQEKKNQARGGIEKAIARIQKQQKQRKQQLEICQKWQEVQQEGLLLQANMYRLKKGMEQISVTDWESGEEKVIELDPRFEPKVEVERRFRQAKRLKSGLEYAENDLIRLELEVQKWKEKQLAVEQVHSYEELEQFLPAKEIKPVAGLPYREYFSQSGYQIWVGKSGSKNEELTFKHAKGLDWWFHIADYPGSHVVLKTTKGEEPDIEAIQDACQLALRYSKAKELSEADVCYTLCKFVSRMGRKGKAGKVQISKHKLMRVRIDDERWKRISQSSSSLKR